MQKKLFVIVLALCSLFFSGIQPVRADGIIIPPGPPPCLQFRCPPIPPRPMAQLVIRYHHVTVTIENQLAVTHVDQVFFNPNEWPVEGTYLFPLPREAVVNDFILWVDGKPVQGEVLDAQQARRTYEEIVSTLRDPALLEYAGQGAVRASIFPIPPQGERRIELEYSQALTAENGLVRYVYPLNTEKFSAEPLQDVSIQVEIRDRQAIRAVYSPSHSVAVDKRGANHVVAGYEAQNLLPDSDFDLYYSVGESEAFHLFSYRDPGDPQDGEGFFLALLAPKPEIDPEPVAKDVLLVLDRSGSMDGEKFEQAQQALRYILEHLNPQDRFYLQSFSTGVESYSDRLRPADEAAEAQSWIDRLGAAGSTDINRALLEAAAVMDAERPTYLIFLTDGLPTVGVIDTQEILKNLERQARPNLRLFTFGVGYDVETVLLDSLAQEHHGLSTYVRPGESIDERVSAFYERISTPVLTSLSIDFGELSTFDVYPNPLPDLFAGSQVVIVGRYRGGGATDITLAGEVNGQQQSFRFAEQVFTTDSRGNLGAPAMLPRLWATRKIGYLLNQVRRNGPDPETIDQIVALSIRYGIVTEYTSYLVTEPAPFGAESRRDISDQAFKAAENSPAAPSGEGAVNRAAQEGAMQSAEVAPAVGGATGSMDENGGSAIRVVGARTFLLNEGVWTDTTYDPQAGTVQKITFLSKAYYDLLAARPDLAAALALGNQVIVVVDGRAYQVVEEDFQPEEAPEPLTLPEPVSTATTAPPALQTATPARIAQGATQGPAAATEPPANQPAPTGCPGIFIPVALAGLGLWKKRFVA